MAGDSYWHILGRVFGSAGELVQHAGSLLTLTANKMLAELNRQEAKPPEPQPEGDVYTNTDRSRQWEPDELHKDFRGQASPTFGFNADHMSKGKRNHEQP